MKKLFIPPTLIAYCIASMILLYLFVPKFNFLYFPYNMLGLLVAFSGFILMGKARDLFKLRATTLKIEKSNHLIKEGVFLKTRNPMYCGMFILILGFSILSTNILALLLPLTFLLLVGRVFVRKEEKLMQDTFGEEYLEYKKAVRRWI